MHKADETLGGFYKAIAECFGEIHGMKGMQMVDA